jgi:hypothetical protein
MLIRCILVVELELPINHIVNKITINYSSVHTLERVATPRVSIAGNCPYTEHIHSTTNKNTIDSVRFMLFFCVGKFQFAACDSKVARLK